MHYSSQGFHFERNFLIRGNLTLRFIKKKIWGLRLGCAGCDYVWVGQTKRDLKSRIAEHKRAIKFQRHEKSAFCEHLMEFDHTVDWNGSTILKYESNYH